MSEKPLEILLIEDNPADAVLFQETIMQNEPDTFHVTVAPSFAVATDYLKNTVFDAMLLDLSLPDSSGLDTVFRARNISPNIPVVVLTGIADETIGTEAIRHGVQDYLVKGQADTQQISRAIRYAIERKIAQNEREISIELLKLVNSNRTVDDVIKAAVAFFREKTGCDATGISLKHGEDYPFSNSAGFSEQSVASQNSVLIRNKYENYALNYTNLNIILDRLKSVGHLFTDNGSFWTNNASRFLDSIEDSDRRQQIKSFCNLESFESAAIIPLRVETNR